MRKRWRLLIPALAGSTILAAGVAVASGPASAPKALEQVAVGDEMPSTVEDFAYPGAEGILKEKNLKLKRGDGHIVLADCGSDPNLMKFLGRDRDEFCFKVTGDKGYLTLEVPAVTGVQTKDHSAHINMTVGDERKSYDVGKNDWQGIGEPNDPAGRDHTLVEIRTSK
ncbi:hypothetical protein ABZ611_26270 [Streptomyces sp. NPDC007861]|uniref:hypothetical protein n=1 Tax=Streptomyces sp. NPDC007861 TaxID=3154893 RepID=UPI003403A836